MGHVFKFFRPHRHDEIREFGSISDFDSGVSPRTTHEPRACVPTNPFAPSYSIFIQHFRHLSIHNTTNPLSISSDNNHPHRRHITIIYICEMAKPEGIHEYEYITTIRLAVSLVLVTLAATAIGYHLHGFWFSVPAFGALLLHSTMPPNARSQTTKYALILLVGLVVVHLNNGDIHHYVCYEYTQTTGSTLRNHTATGIIHNGTTSPHYVQCYGTHLNPASFSSIYSISNNTRESCITAKDLLAGEQASRDSVFLFLKELGIETEYIDKANAWIRSNAIVGENIQVGSWGDDDNRPTLRIEV